MKYLIAPRSFIITAFSFAFVIYSCSKGGGGTPPDPCAGVIVAVSGTTTNPTAPGATDGNISVSATGGSGFTFSINGGAFQSSGSFTGLAGGSYTVTAKNSSGCTGSSSFTLTAANPCAGVTITVTGTVTNPTSGTSNNGSIVANATGSTGFTYRINNGAYQTSGTFSNLGAGSFTIDAKDANGCTGSANFTLTAPNPCAGVTISVSTAVAGTIPCEANSGTITVTPSGGTATYTFSLNGGAFQVSNIFSGLGANTYTITAKDANGCTGTGSATISNLAAGPLFSAVRTVMQNNCISCHNNTLSEGGMNWTIDCNIVQQKDRIKARAVDGAPSPMPTTGLLPAGERQKITDWINAGGKFTN